MAPSSLFTVRDASSKPIRHLWLLVFVLLADTSNQIALGQEIILDGSLTPTSQGWAAQGNVVPPDVSTDGVADTFNTIGTTRGGPAYQIIHKNPINGSDKSYILEIRLKVNALQAPHAVVFGVPDAAVAFFPSYTSGYSQDYYSEHDRMIYFDTHQIGWGDDSDTFVVDTTDSFHIYRFELPVSGSWRVLMDGVPVLSRFASTPNLRIALGDISTDEGRNSSFSVESITLFPDCNGNGIDDSIDFQSGFPDCNGNGRPDSCDLGHHDEYDCNHNGIPDSCDLADATSTDCDHDGKPDECEPDCQPNGVADWCDIVSGTSTDCNGNHRPDECELAGNDCNNNGIHDRCDVAAGTSTDCNGNYRPDECELVDCNGNSIMDSCDIFSGFSQDSNGDGVPDECPGQDPYPVGRDPTYYNKCKFISFVTDAHPQAQTAIRVRFASLHEVNPPYTGAPSIPFMQFQGQYVWVGPPAVYVESESSGVPFTAAITQCTPYYQDWTTVGLLHVTGSHIVPSSTYLVEQVSKECEGHEDTCTIVSPSLLIKTTRFGDVEVPFNPPSVMQQSDFADTSALVAKFRAVPSSISKARSIIAVRNAFGEILPADIEPDLGFANIAAAVDAFKGLAYPGKMGKCANSTAACSTNTECGPYGPCNLYCP